MTTLTLKEAAIALRIHPQTLRVRAKAGKIPGAAKPGRAWVFIQADLEDYIRSLSIAETPHKFSSSDKFFGKREFLKDVLETRIRLGSGPYIYFLFQGPQLVYIGASNNLLRRLGDHCRDKRFDSFAFTSCDEATLYYQEAELIRRFRPKYNGTTVGRILRGQPITSEELVIAAQKVAPVSVPGS